MATPQDGQLDRRIQLFGVIGLVNGAILGLSAGNLVASTREAASADHPLRVLTELYWTIFGIVCVTSLGLAVWKCYCRRGESSLRSLNLHIGGTAIVSLMAGAAAIYFADGMQAGPSDVEIGQYFGAHQAKFARLVALRREYSDIVSDANPSHGDKVRTPAFAENEYQNLLEELRVQPAGLGEADQGLGDTFSMWQTDQTEVGLAHFDVPSPDSNIFGYKFLDPCDIDPLGDGWFIYRGQYFD